MSNTTQKSAFISILGRPNVGKSSLLNKIIGQKIAIVSSKPQTTRTRIMGVYTKGEEQLVFIDTPGFHKPKNLLGQNMINIVNTGFCDVEAAVLVVDAHPGFTFDPQNLPPAEIELIKNIKQKNLSCILVINKIDLLPEKEDLLTIISAYSKAYNFASVIPLSAKTGDGVKYLVSDLLKFTKPSPHFFDADCFTDQTDETMVAEIIREKLLRILDKEVPHGIAVGIDKLVERDTSTGEPIIELQATIYCEKNSHKAIIIGKGGATLKKIGTVARIDIEKFYGIRANLSLWVKVKEDWRNKEGLIHSFGLDYGNK